MVPSCTKTGGGRVQERPRGTAASRSHIALPPQPLPCAAPNLVCGTIRHHYSINAQNVKIVLSCYCQQQVAHGWDGCPHAGHDATHRVCGEGAEQQTTEGGLSNKLGSQHRNNTADAPVRPDHAASQLT